MTVGTRYRVGMTKREMAEYLADADNRDGKCLTTREERVALHMRDSLSTLKWRYDHYRKNRL